MSTLFLRQTDFLAIAEHARRALPREACGLLIGSGDARQGFSVTRIVESENLAPPGESDRFEIDPALLLRLHRTLREVAAAGEAAAKAGAQAGAAKAERKPGAQAGAEPERILGLYHSHPGGRPEPSPVDRERAAAPGYVWLIAALDKVAVGASSVETRAFLHADGLEPARFEALALVLRDD